MTLGFAFALSEICHLWPMAVNAMTSRLSRHENDALLTSRFYTSDRTSSEWCEAAISAPLRRERQSDGRIRHWRRIFDTPDGKSRILRVVALGDGETIHNAFFDRNFR
jgi:hypothetical protein